MNPDQWAGAEEGTDKPERDLDIPRELSFLAEAVKVLLRSHDDLGKRLNESGVLTPPRPVEMAEGTVEKELDVAPLAERLRGLRYDIEVVSGALTALARRLQV